MGHNGFFGSLSGPFEANQELFSIIQQQCNKTINYITKLGIHYIENYDLKLEEPTLVKPTTFPLIVSINNIDFQIGKTGMLELEDVQITSIQFKQDVNNQIFIDYQYQ